MNKVRALLIFWLGFLVVGLSATTHAMDDEIRTVPVNDAERYLMQHYDDVKADAAMGEGIYIEQFARLLGENDPSVFGEWMNQHYQTIFNAKSVQETLQHIHHLSS